MLKSIIESLIFASGKGVSLTQIKKHFAPEYSSKEVLKALTELQSQYTTPCGIILIEFDGKYQFQSNAEYSERIQDLINPIKERELSKTLLEVLSVVAYKQPVTRLDVEDIRGVSSDYAFSVLLKLNLIFVSGQKDSIGKPSLYSTSEEFLKKFQLTSLSDLPDYDEIMFKIRNNFDKYYKETNSLYRDRVIADDDSFALVKGGELQNLQKELVAAAIDDVDNIGSEELDQIPDFLKGEDIILID